MCDDCEQAIEAVIANKPKCRCTKCRAGGSVLAIQAPPRLTRVGLQPWCVGCHHFILVENRPQS